MRSIQLSDDEDMMEPVRPVARVSRAPSGSTLGAVKTRLEAPRIQQSSHSSSSAAGPSGYRIVVSNLQSTVTHEDIRVRFVIPTFTFFLLLLCHLVCYCMNLIWVAYLFLCVCVCYRLN